MDQTPGPLPPPALGELARHGWQIIANALGHAATETTLVAHWFLAPNDDAVQTDPHFGGNPRTAKFLRVVVPTLADQLSASMFAVAVPWDLDGDLPLMVLLYAISGQRPAIEARRLHRNDGAISAPWWRLGSELVSVPDELAAITSAMSV